MLLYVRVVSMTGQIMLFAYSYTFILGFFWILMIAISVVHRLRQERLERLELAFVPVNKQNAAMTHLLAYVHSPMDEIEAWHYKAQEKPERIPGPSVLPMRYRQTLLFGDDLGETERNPRIKAS
jgi:hypothetical protein